MVQLLSGKTLMTFRTIERSQNFFASYISFRPEVQFPCIVGTEKNLSGIIFVGQEMAQPNKEIIMAKKICAYRVAFWKITTCRSCGRKLKVLFTHDFRSTDSKALRRARRYVRDQSAKEQHVVFKFKELLIGTFTSYRKVA